MADMEQIIQQCHDLLAQLPDAQQRQAVNRLAVRRYERRILDRVRRGSATTSSSASIGGAATPSGLAGGTRRTRGAATDPGPPRGYESLAGVEVRP